MMNWNLTFLYVKNLLLSRGLLNEGGEKQNDYALLIALVVVAVMAILFVMGPQVAIIYAQAAQVGAGTP